jgi:hypothetical protein
VLFRSARLEQVGQALGASTWSLRIPAGSFPSDPSRVDSEHQWGAATLDRPPMVQTTLNGADFATQISHLSHGMISRQHSSMDACNAESLQFQLPHGFSLIFDLLPVIVLNRPVYLAQFASAYRAKPHARRLSTYSRVPMLSCMAQEIMSACTPCFDGFRNRVTTALSEEGIPMMKTGSGRTRCRVSKGAFLRLRIASNPTKIV